MSGRLVPTGVAVWAWQGPQTKSHREPLAQACGSLGTWQGLPSPLLVIGCSWCA